VAILNPQGIVSFDQKKSRATYKSARFSADILEQLLETF
jgi:hypothetical protein